MSPLTPNNNSYSTKCVKVSEGQEQNFAINIYIDILSALLKYLTNPSVAITSSKVSFSRTNNYLRLTLYLG